VRPGTLLTPIIDAPWRLRYSGPRLQDWTPHGCEMIAQGKVHIGMNAAQVRLAWGNRERINETEISGRVSQQWVMSENEYLYFDDGILTAIQQSK